MNKLILLMIAIPLNVFAQSKERSLTVDGKCNAVAVGSDIKIEIRCGEGLTKDNAQKMAYELRDLKDAINKNGVTATLLLSNLKSLNKELRQPKSTTNQASTGIGIAVANGSVNDSPVTVNFGVRKPPPPISFTQILRKARFEDPYTIEKTHRGIKIDPPTEIPVVDAVVTLEDDFFQPALKAVCDKPCTMNGLTVDPWQGAITIDRYPLTEANSYVMTVARPSTLLRKTKLFTTVSADDGKEFKLIKIEAFMMP